MARSGTNRKGTIDLTATVANACGLTVHGALINDAGATITVGGTAGARTLTAQLDNLGTLNVGLPLTINRGSADHRNLGTINVTGGDLTLAQSGTTPLFT